MPETMKVPPALDNRPQFTSDYWRKVPRSTLKLNIVKVNRKGDWVEIHLSNGLAFQRPASDIQQLLTPGTAVEIEAIGNGEIITGLLVEGIGWAFRMTAEDLANYTRELAARIYNQQQETREAMIAHVTVALEATLNVLGVIFGDTTEDDDENLGTLAHKLAVQAVFALETGPE